MEIKYHNDYISRNGEFNITFTLPEELLKGDDKTVINNILNAYYEHIEKLIKINNITSVKVGEVDGKK